MQLAVERHPFKSTRSVVVVGRRLASNWRFMASQQTNRNSIVYWSICERTEMHIGDLHACSGAMDVDVDAETIQ